MPNEQDRNNLRKFYYKTYTENEKLQNKYIPRKKKSLKATKRLSVRLTDAENKIIESKSREAGLSKAAFLKQSALGKEVKSTNPEIVIKIVEMDEKLNRLLTSGMEAAAPVRNEFNVLKDKFFVE